MKRIDTPPDEYLATLSGEVHDSMTTLDVLIGSAMPGRSRTLWAGTFWGGTDQSIIGYGDVTQERPPATDAEWFAVGLARQARHYSVYVNVVDGGAYLPKAFAGRLGKVKVGAASIGFGRITDIDLDVLRAMVERAHMLLGSPA